MMHIKMYPHQAVWSSSIILYVISPSSTKGNIYFLGVDHSFDKKYYISYNKILFIFFGQYA